MNMSRYISKKLKRAVYDKFDNKCANCGCIENKFYYNETFEIDHIVPYSQGGETSLENLQLLCRECHEEKTYEDGSGDL